MRRVLITGANGFIGTNLVDTFAMLGDHVIAGVRSGSDHSSLNGKPCVIVYLNYLDAEALRKSITELKPDVVVHCAGITVAAKLEAYHLGNVQSTKNLLDALSYLPKTKFVFLSSLAARGPGPSVGDDPLSAYGKSKWQAEQFVKTSPINWTIIRPTAVYGPGDKAFFPLFNWARKGIFIQLGSAQRKLTFVHVSDVCKMVVSVLDGQPKQIRYAWDGIVYEQRAVIKAFQHASGKSGFVLSIPAWVFTSITTVADLLIRRIMRLPWAYPPEKLKELLADDWSITTEEVKNGSIDLKTGFSETFKSYFH